MLNGYDNAAIILASVVLSCCLLLLLNRLWPSTHRRPHNDVIGWQLAIIGTIYAVVIGFMIFAVWGNYQAADMNVDNEASALIDLYQIADGLPVQQRDTIQNLTKEYAHVLIEKEWPAMNVGNPGTAAHPIVQKLWSAVIGTQATTNLEQTSLSHAMDQLSALVQDRHIRQMQGEASLPAILWAVLICGGMITIISACFIGSENTRLHFILILSLSAIISLVLVAISDIDGPFQGSVHIKSDAFVYVLDTMNSHTNVPR
ncbi:MAG TPA: hypothetical protein VMU62_09085 [Acidobacteriaceae bacterium]|nr:hypothetical protein [Acidobacteriaceae bacterium]